MNRYTTLSSRCFTLLLLVVLVPWPASSFAGPGAHGPNGEHLDGASMPAPASGTVPRFEAASDVFELVAQLTGGELSIMIDRFESNAPVLDARVEVESGGRRAQARFHADHGDHAVDDSALIALLSAPGEHALVIAIVAGEDSDLLNGTLKVSGAAARTTRANPIQSRYLVYGAAALGVVLLLVLAWRVRRRRNLRLLQEVRA